MKTFQIVILGIFGLFIVGGIILFATYRAGGSADNGPAEALLWGTLPKESVNEALYQYELENPDSLSVTYREIPEDSFDAELVEALASGQGPDVVLLSQDLILRHENKIQTIPFESYSERSFRDQFIDGADIFLRHDGIIGLPFNIDPLVLYWSRTLLANAGIPQPPRYWDELQSMVPKLAVVDASRAISRAAVPFGEFGNVTHAKELLAQFIMQAGSPIVKRDNTGKPTSYLASRFGTTLVPGESALRFYTEFSNPSKELYTWNRALPNSTESFLGGDLAFYPGFASELSSLRSRNPNLNFDVAEMPQIRDGNTRLTFSKMHALVIMKNSTRIADAYRVVGALSSPQFLKLWTAETDTPPIRRDLLTEVPSDAFGPIFYRSAIIGKAFLDPDPEGTRNIFTQMISDITSGRSLPSEALLDGDSQLKRLLQ